MGVIGPLGGPERVVGHAHPGPGVDRHFAALVRDLAGFTARTVDGHRDEWVGPTRSGRTGVLGEDGIGLGRVHERDGGRDGDGCQAVRGGVGPAAGPLHRLEDGVMAGIDPEPDHRRGRSQRRGAGAGGRQPIRRGETGDGHGSW